jgi:hypothetical protein
MSIDLVNVIEGTASNNSSCSCAPPDVQVAVGYNQVVETVNHAIAVYDKAAGALLSRIDLSTFFSSLGGAGSDPVVIFDEYTGQFVVGVLGGTSRSWKMAFSNDSDPRDGFSFRQYDFPSGTPDFPRMGYNADAWFVTLTLNGPRQRVLMAFDKTTTDMVRTNIPANSQVWTPALMHGASPGDPMWFVERGLNVGAPGGTPSTTIHVIRMDDVLSGTPRLTDRSVTVAPYTKPPSATQPNGTVVQTADGTILSAAYNNGLLVAAHAIGDNNNRGVALARWYEFDTTTTAPSLVQSGTIDQGPGVSTYYPAIDINNNFDIGLAFIETSPSEFASMYVTGQSVNDFGSGTTQTPALTHPGNGNFSNNSRQGDYSGVSVDPMDGYTFWAGAEYKRGLWATGIAAFGIRPDTNSVATASASVVSAKIVAEGTSVPATGKPIDRRTENGSSELDAVTDRLFAVVRRGPDAPPPGLTRPAHTATDDAWLKGMVLP